MGFLSKLFAKPAAVPADPGAGGIGMFTDVGPPPQDPRSMLTAEILPTLTGPPGLRLAGSNDPSGSYFGTDLVPPIRFPLTGKGTANTPEQFEVAALKDLGK